MNSYLSAMRPAPSRRALRKPIVLTVLALFLIPILARAAVFAVGNAPRSWRDADWSSTGTLPAAPHYKPARLLVFTGTSIAQAFFTAAAIFAGMSLWGYTTGQDLSRFSTFLMVGLIGVVLASLVNVFLGSSTLQLVVSIAGVLVFTGLTAWDTQRLKSEYLAYAGTQDTEKLAVMGALSLYLNLINLFQLLLGLMGQREE